MHLSELETPSVIIDLDRLEANILRLQNYLSHYGIANRPHVKTHKIPAIAHLQINAGAVGITCQKLGEAEVMAEAGIKDIFLPYNLIGAAKLERLMRRRQVGAADEPGPPGANERHGGFGNHRPGIIGGGAGSGADPPRFSRM
jgi:D-serine deaminase-like pyridoxal phosphate-dependent protein